MIYHVSCHVAGSGDGTAGAPFQTIQEAADRAFPGDQVVVAPGIYREHVRPRRSGTEDAPIVYRAEVIGQSTITGAEEVKHWESYQGTVWRARIPGDWFGAYNPYATVLEGDWYYTEMPLHTGEVYLDGKSMYEMDSLAAVLDPVPSEASLDEGFSIYQWHTAQEDGVTVLYANFHGADPNARHVEINVRRNCFYPEQTGVDYITVSGFCLRQAATTWAPPTAYQEGLIGPHWSKGWVIEDCEISDSKCVGISIGKYLQPNNENKWTKKRLKQGTQTERDAICQAQREGWTKERIGGHVIRRCVIHDCGQAGIVGHLGCVFSVIEDNHIYDINKKRQLTGAEIADVKLHAALDVEFRRNHVHHCTRGLWLDWQAQGTRVSGNVFHHNFPERADRRFATPLDIGEDLFVEVSHGPTLIDNNVFLSYQACRLAAQGMAFVHNLIGGSFTSVGTGTDNVSGIETLSKAQVEVRNAGPRYTPYHVPHRTEVAGFMTILHGDNRFYNNVFVQMAAPGTYDALFRGIGLPPQNSVVGTFPFDDYPTNEEYLEAFFLEGDCKLRENRLKYYARLPVATGGNVFLQGARPCKKEQRFAVGAAGQVAAEQGVAGVGKGLGAVGEERGVAAAAIEQGSPTVAVGQGQEGWHLTVDLGETLPMPDTAVITTETLGEAFEPEQLFEYPDGSPIVFELDYFGNLRGEQPIPGPFERRQRIVHCMHHT